MKKFGTKGYIGKHVYAGGELNGIWGTIVGIEPDEDFEDHIWYIVKDDEYGGLHKYDLCEIKEQVITTKLVPLH